MVLYAVAAKEVILCKSYKSKLVKILRLFAVLEVISEKSRKCAPVASKLKCRRMADQMEPIDVEFLTMVFLEITGQ